MNRIARVIAAFVAFGCLGGAGACGTSYQPRPSAQLRFVIHHGGAFYVKNGQEYPVGPLGGALGPLVASSPPAAALAHRARTQLAVGIPLYVGGVAAVVVGLALSGGATPWIVRGAGAASLGTGLGFMGAGFTNAVDAVNVYNDSAGGPDRSP